MSIENEFNIKNGIVKVTISATVSTAEELNELQRSLDETNAHLSERKEAIVLNEQNVEHRKALKAGGNWFLDFFRGTV